MGTKNKSFTRRLAENGIITRANVRAGYSRGVFLGYREGTLPEDLQGIDYFLRTPFSLEEFISQWKIREAGREDPLAFWWKLADTCTVARDQDVIRKGTSDYHYFITTVNRRWRISWCKTGTLLDACLRLDQAWEANTGGKFPYAHKGDDAKAWSRLGDKYLLFRCEYGDVYHVDNDSEKYSKIIYFPPVSICEGSHTFGLKTSQYLDDTISREFAKIASFDEDQLKEYIKRRRPGVTQ